MALCLEQYLDNLQALPGELQRKLLLLRELDKKAHAHLVEGDRLTSEFLTGGDKMTPADRKEWYKKIQDEYSQAKNIGDEKVQLAMQTYEMVDKHIRRLDNDLARFENELKRNILAPKSGDSGDSTIAPSGAVASDASAASATDKKMSKKSDAVATTDGKDKKKRKLEESAPKSSKKKRKDEIIATARQDGSTALSKQKAVQQLTALSGVGFIQQFAGGSADVMDMPIDPNEPVYCICRQVSYGEMIGCDNPDCPIEWFHFNCVGLSSKPKGKWYCTRCTEEKKKHKTAS